MKNKFIELSRLVPKGRFVIKGNKQYYLEVYDEDQKKWVEFFPRNEDEWVAIVDSLVHEILTTDNFTKIKK